MLSKGRNTCFDVIREAASDECLRAPSTRCRRYGLSVDGNFSRRLIHELPLMRLVTSLIGLFSVLFPLSQSCRAQSDATADVQFGGGVAVQFARVVNTGWQAGYDVHAMAGWRVSERKGLRLWLGYETFRTAPDSLGTEDVRASYVHVGLRSDLSSPNAGVRSFFLIGFGIGTSEQTVVRNSVRSLENTAIQFGLGFPVRLATSMDLVPMIRFVIGANSGFTIPVTVGLRWNLR